MTGRRELQVLWNTSVLKLSYYHSLVRINMILDSTRKHMYTCTYMYLVLRVKWSSGIRKRLKELRGNNSVSYKTVPEDIGSRFLNMHPFGTHL